MRKRTGFAVPSAGRNHYFFTPVHDPYSVSRAKNHYDKLQQDWLEEDVREAGGSSALISNMTEDVVQDLSRSPARRASGSSSQRSQRSSPSRSPSRSSGGSSSPGHRAGKTPWEPKILTLADIADKDEAGKIVPTTTLKLKSGHLDKPRFKTQRQLLAHRAESMLPDISFDVDGDGVVSGQDFFLASKFDVNNDGHLDDEERLELRKRMVKTVAEAYKKVPKSQNDAAEAMVQEFTRDLDETVRKKDFKQRFEALYNATAVSMTWESNRIKDGLQPFENKAGTAARSVVGNKGGPSVRTEQEKADRPHNPKQSMMTQRSNDTVDLEREPTWLKGGERMRFSGYQSRAALLKSRREAYRQMADRRQTRRVKQHVLARNEQGADLPMPRSWGPVGTHPPGTRSGVGPEEFDTNR